MTNVDPSEFCARNRKQVFGTADALLHFEFGTHEALKRALSAFQRGPIYHNNVIACEAGAADFVFFVVSGVVRSCKAYENGGRSISAFYLPGNLFGFTDLKYCHLSVEAATDAMVLFIKRVPLLSIALRERRVASFLLAITTNELRRAHAVLMSIHPVSQCS